MHVRSTEINQVQTAGKATAMKGHGNTPEIPRFARNDRKRERNGSSTLERRILVSESDTHGNEEFPKKEVETLWAPWRVQYFEGTARPRFSSNGGACER